MTFVILDKMNAFSLSLFDNAFMYSSRIMLGEKVYLERLVHF